MKNDFVEFAKGLFDAGPLLTNAGYTWTLASRVGNMLSEIEEIGVVSYNIHCNFTNYGSVTQSWALCRTSEQLTTIA